MSPAEYPDMVLITREELDLAVAEGLARALKLEERRHRALADPPTHAYPVFTHDHQI